MSEDKRSGDDELQEKIRKRKLMKQQEEEEEEEAKKRQRQMQDTEEDDENLREDDKDDESNKHKDNNEDEEDDDENDEEENDDENDNDDDSEQDNDEGEKKDSDEKQDEQKDNKNNDDNGTDKNKKDNNQSSENNNKPNSKDDSGMSSSNRNSSGGKPQHTSPSSQSSGMPNAGNANAQMMNQGGHAASTGNAAMSGGTSVGAGTGAGSAAASGGAAAGTGAGGAAAGGAIGVLGWVLIVIIIIILLIGIIAFFIMMPGAVVGKIGQAIDNFRIVLDDWKNGSKAASLLVGQQEVANAAEYVSQMGYDLEGFGFLGNPEDSTQSTSTNYIKLSARVDNGTIASIKEWWGSGDETDPSNLALKDFSTETIENRKAKDKEDGIEEEYEYVYVYVSQYNENDSEDEIKEHIAQVIDGDGTIAFAKSKYLAMYLTADNATYLIRNYHIDWQGRLLKLVGREPTRDEGSGLIYFVEENAENRKASDYIEGLNEDWTHGFANAESWFIDRAAVNRPARILRIANSNDGWFKSTYYDYSLDGWASKYGVPLQLSLSFHLSSLAPDFAYEVAKIGAEDTCVEMGLLKTTGNSVHSKILLDLGDGEKFYYIEEDVKSEIHTSANGDNESGYSTPEEAQQYTENSDYSGEKGKEQSEGTSFKTALELLEEIEEDIKQKTNNGQNKLIAGSLVYQAADDSDGADQYLASLYDNSQGNSRVGGYCTTISDNNIMLIRDVLLDYNIAEYNENGKFKVKSGYEGSTEVNKVRDIILNYFKLRKIDEALYCNIANDTGIVSPTISSNTGMTVRQAIESGSLSETDSNGENYTPSFGKYYYNTSGGETFWIVEGDENGVVNGGTSRQSGFIQYGLNSVYCNSDMYSFYQMHIIGDYENIMDLEKMWEFVVDSVMNYFPFRQYYRLVDEDGNVVTSLTDGKDYNDYEYVGGADSYWENDEGWFWRKSIPKDLINAISEKLPDDEGINAEETKEILDQMYEYDTEDFTRYVPIILEVKDHWYQDLTFKGCYKWDESSEGQKSVYPYTSGGGDNSGISKASAAEIIYLEETSKGRVVQIKDAKRKGRAGAQIKNLIDNYDYYKYDGTGRSKDKSKINFADTAVDAIAMLEEIQGEDAQSIIRDFKALMKQYDIYFEETQGTALKKELYSKIIEGYSDKEKILTEGDDCVIKANIPPTQEGFEPGINVKSPIAGTIVYRTDDSICIEISAPNEEYDKYTILISGFEVGNVSVNQTVSDGTILGKTKRQDLKLTMRDENGAIIKNEYSMTLEHDYVVKTDEPGGQTYSKDDIRTALQNYNGGQFANGPWGDESVVDALYNIQETYNVDPIFAAAVTITESSAGTANTTLIQQAHNWVSIKGSGFSYNGSQWNYYSSFADALEGSNGFGNLMANSGYYFAAGNIHISEIGPTYCDWDWSVKTAKYMQQLLECIGEGDED